MQPLCEAYRPKTCGELIAQPGLVKKIDTLRKRGLSGRGYWISGPSGGGKTTIARLIAREVADPFATYETDAGSVTTATVRDMAERFSRYGWGELGGHAWIINEAHGLRKDTMRALLVLFDDLPQHVSIFFTTTEDGQAELFEGAIDAAPLLSRCTILALARRDVAGPFAERVRDIATAEGLNGKPLTAYVRLLKECRNNMRAALQAVEAGRMITEA